MKLEGILSSSREPVQDMRSVIHTVCSDRVCVLDGTASEIPVDWCSQDAVVIAQAFHWFANQQSIEEIHRVLKPGGGLACVWNFEDTSKRNWVGLCREMLIKYESGSPQYRLRGHEQVWKSEAAERLFELPIRRIHFEHFRLYSRAQYIEKLLSKSYISKRSPEEIEDIRKECMETLDKADDIQLVFNEKEANGEPLLLHPYVTDLEYTFKKK
jgi:ubiquinone/menaquinone biosynthesis C-methylase UbiE